MNKQELIAILLNDTDNPESDHGKADEALLEYIDDKEITEAFHSLTKWYA